MQTKILFILAFILLYKFVLTQNLVPNHNFEQAWTCPQSYTTHTVKELVPHWRNPTRGTPDYFHVCSDSIAGIPENFAGFMYPFEGRGYIGLILREVFDSTHKSVRGVSREYVQAKLKEPLIKNKLYCISLQYANANRSTHSVDALGVTLTKESIRARDAGNILQMPQIINRPGHIMNNKKTWTELCGIYRARGNERYISIGNFLDNDQTGFQKNTDSLLNPEFIYAYYYIDAVRVFEIENSFECGCSEINSFGMDWMADNYDPETGYNSLNYKNRLLAEADAANQYNDNKLLADQNNSEKNNYSKDSKDNTDLYYDMDSDSDNLNKHNNNEFGNNKSDQSEIDSANHDLSYSGSHDNTVEESKTNDKNSSESEINGRDSNFNSDLLGKDSDSLNESLSGSYSDKEMNEAINIDDLYSGDILNPFARLESSITEQAFENVKIGDRFRLNRIFFDFNSSELISASYSELDNLSGILNDKSGIRIEIRGHTDNIGTNSYNRRLSISRAAAVYDYLLNKGIDKTRMKYRGFGSNVPVADNETDEGRALNRRVEIVIIDL